MCCENQQEALNDLIQAIYDNDSEYVRAHVGHIQNLDAIGIKGNNPLTRAINDDDIEIVQLLLAHGVNLNLNIEAYGGATPLHLAISRAEDAYQIDLQENNYADGVQADLTLVRYLLGHHPNLNLKNSRGETVSKWFSGWKELHDLIEAERQWQIDNNYQHK